MHQSAFFSAGPPAPPTDNDVTQSLCSKWTASTWGQGKLGTTKGSSLDSVLLRPSEVCYLEIKIIIIIITIIVMMMMMMMMKTL